MGSVEHRDDAESILVICRDIPGPHVGGPECWCVPFMVAAEDEVAIQRILSLKDQRQA